MAAKCDRLATGSPVACTAATLPAVHSGTQVGHGRVQPEEPVLARQQPVGRDRDPRPGGVVARVAVRDDEGEPVRPAAERDHDEDRAWRWPRMAGEAVTTAPPTMVVAPASASAPPSRPRRETRAMAAYSSQQ